MQAELQGWQVVAGHGRCKSAQGPLQLTSKIGNEEKAGDWLRLVCPVSAGIRPATTPQLPGDSDIPDISAMSGNEAYPV
jgi:hypothetical protein